MAVYNSKTELAQAKRAMQLDIAQKLYTQTRTPVTKIAIEAGANTCAIHDWAKTHGWTRPPKESPLAPEPVQPSEYHARYLHSIGVYYAPAPLPPTPGGPPRKMQPITKNTSAPAKDGFSISQAQADRDRSEVLQRQRRERNDRIKELWDDGLEMKVIARRLRVNVPIVRYTLKALGADTTAPRRGRLDADKRSTQYLFGNGVSRNVRSGNWQRRT